MGATHLRYALTGGGVYVADGSELLLISAITMSLSDEWNLVPVQRGALVTVVYLGMLLGTLSSGPIGDKYGRKLCIMTAYAATFVTCMACAEAQNYTTLVLIRFCVGVSIGCGIPAYNALLVEITPKHGRMIMQMLGCFLFTAGEIYASFLVFLDDPSLKNLHWRNLVRLCAAPAAVFFAVSMLCLNQSPSYLAVCGQCEKAKDVLKSNAVDNGVPDLDVDFTYAPAPKLDKQVLGSQFAVLFNKQFLATTLVCILTTIMNNVLYYGCLYAYPQVLPELEESSSASAAMQLLIGALWEIPGEVLGIIFGAYLYRKPMMKITMAVNAFFIFCFVIGTTQDWGLSTDILFHVGYYGNKCFVMCSFSAIYLLSSEVYPTSIRITGNSVCVACGRIGAMLSPLCYEFMFESTGSHALFFYIMGTALVINTLLIDFIPFEPAIQHIPDFVDDLSTGDGRSVDYGALQQAA